MKSLRALPWILLVFVSSTAHARLGDTRCLPKNVVKTSPAGRRTIKATVVRTVDGDTIKADIGDTELSIRFLTIDTPETHYQGKSQGIWGERATEALSELLPDGTAITIELDQEVCDRYGRLLGYVFKGRQNINRAMLEQALAVNYCIAPNTAYCESFATVTRKQVRDRNGIFGDPSLEVPYEWRRIKSDRPYEKFMGSIKTHEVLEPGPVERIPVADRVFFLKKSDIKAPYVLEAAE